MRFLKPITVAAVLLAQLPALGAELAVLRNGFSIRFERREQTGNVTRLYTGTGYVDVATDQIASFEVEEALVAPPVAAVASAPSAVPSPATAANAASPSVATATPASLPAASIPPAQPLVSTANAANADLDQVVRDAARRNRLDPDFVNSVIKAESNFKARAVSKKGAQGLMQLMPSTAAQLGVSNPFDPRQNVEAGTAHLSALLDMYHDDPVKALAAYNAGAHRVKQYNGVPPYYETRTYIAQIVRDFNARKRAQMKAATATAKTSKPAATPAKSVSSKPPRKAKPQQTASLAGGN
jgi:soluble lytic murein transglycosylase-like protein